MASQQGPGGIISAETLPLSLPEEKPVVPIFVCYSWGRILIPFWKSEIMWKYTLGQITATAGSCCSAQKGNHKSLGSSSTTHSKVALNSWRWFKQKCFPWLWVGTGCLTCLVTESQLKGQVKAGLQLLKLCLNKVIAPRERLLQCLRARRSLERKKVQQHWSAEGVVYQIPVL